MVLAPARLLAAGSRIENRTAKQALRIAINEIAIARSSSLRAPETSSVGSSHWAIRSPAVANSVDIVITGAEKRSGLITALSRTRQRPTVRPRTGESPA